MSAASAFNDPAGRELLAMLRKARRNTPSRVLLLMDLAARPTLAEVPLADLSFEHQGVDQCG